MDALKLAGLWKTRDRNGNVFLSGRLNTMNKILILPNTGKQKDEDPDYFFILHPLSQGGLMDLEKRKEILVKFVEM
jgi:hypothetical protein